MDLDLRAKRVRQLNWTLPPRSTRAAVIRTHAGAIRLDSAHRPPDADRREHAVVPTFKRPHQHKSDGSSPPPRAADDLGHRRLAFGLLHTAAMISTLFVCGRCLTHPDRLGRLCPFRAPRPTVTPLASDGAVGTPSRVRAVASLVDSVSSSHGVFRLAWRSSIKTTATVLAPLAHSLTLPTDAADVGDPQAARLLASLTRSRAHRCSSSDHAATGHATSSALATQK